MKKKIKNGSWLSEEVVGENESVCIQIHTNFKPKNIHGGFDISECGENIYTWKFVILSLRGNFDMLNG